MVVFAGVYIVCVCRNDPEVETRASKFQFAHVRDDKAGCMYE